MISYDAIWLKSLNKLSFWLTLNFPALWTDSQVFPLTNLNFLELVCYQMLCIGLSFWSFWMVLNTLWRSSALQRSLRLTLKKWCFRNYFFHLDIFYSSFIINFLQTFLVDLMIMLDLNEQDFVRDGFGWFGIMKCTRKNYVRILRTSIEVFKKY